MHPQTDLPTPPPRAVEVVDLRVDVPAFVRLRSADPVDRTRLLVLVAVAITPAVVAAATSLPLYPALVVGACVLAFASFPVLDASSPRPLTFRLDETGITIRRGRILRSAALQTMKDPLVVAGVGVMLRFEQLRVTIPDHALTPDDREAIHAWAARADTIRAMGGEPRWATLTWGSPTSTLPHRPSGRPAARALLLVVLALGLAGFALFMTWNSPSQQMIASIAVSTAVPLTAGLVILAAQLGWNAAEPATQSCVITEDALRLSNESTSLEIAGSALMSIIRTSRAVDIRYHGGLICLPKRAFDGLRHRDEFASALRHLRDASSDRSADAG